MLTIDDAIDKAVEAEHEDNTRKLAAIVRNCMKVSDNLEDRLTKIEAFVTEAYAASDRNMPLTNDNAHALLEKAHKLSVVPIDPMTHQIVY